MRRLARSSLGKPLNVLPKLIGPAPLFGRSLGEPGFDMGVGMYFHGLQDTEKSACGHEYCLAEY